MSGLLAAIQSLTIGSLALMEFTFQVTSETKTGDQAIAKDVPQPQDDTAFGLRT